MRDRWLRDGKPTPSNQKRAKPPKQRLKTLVNVQKPHHKRLNNRKPKCQTKPQCSEFVNLTMRAPGSHACFGPVAEPLSSCANLYRSGRQGTSRPNDYCFGGQGDTLAHKPKPHALAPLTSLYSNLQQSEPYQQSSGVSVGTASQEHSTSEWADWSPKPKCYIHDLYHCDALVPSAALRGCSCPKLLFAFGNLSKTTVSVLSTVSLP